MPQYAGTIENLPMAFALVKAMQADGPEWAAAIVVSAARRLPRSSSVGWPKRAIAGSTASTAWPCATAATAPSHVIF